MSQLAPIVLFTGVQRLARQLRGSGLQTACLREGGEQVAFPEDVDIWVPYSPLDLEALGAWARAWPLGPRVAAVLNRRERRVMEHAVLNEALGLPGIRLAQARILRDKLLLRQALSRAPMPLNPAFDQADLASSRLPAIPFPFLLKPRNLFKSQLITLCRDPETWHRARRELTRSRDAAGARHGVPVAETFVAEAFVDGREVSLDAFVGPDGEMIFTPAVALTPARRWGMEDFHVAVRQVPSGLAVEQEALARRAVAEAAGILGLRSTPMHVDLVLGDGRAFILDAAPRIGGYRSEMMQLAFGAPLDPMGLELAMGRSVQWRPQREDAAAVVEIFPPGPGRLAAIGGLEAVRGVASLRRIGQRMAPGEVVGWAKDGFRCPLFAVLAHRDPQRVADDVQRLRTMIRVEVSPS